MTAAELRDTLIDAGFTVEQADAAIKSEKLAARAANLTQKQEYDSLLAKAQKVESDFAKAKTYQDWYAANYQAVEALKEKAARYEATYGTLEAPRAGAAGGGGASLDEASIQRLVQNAVTQTIQTEYAPRWSNLLKGFATVTDRHVRNKREYSLDVDELGKIAERYNGDMLKAYEEVDRPYAEKAAAAKAESDKKAADKEIERRVDEELQKRGRSGFPSTGDPFSSPKQSLGLRHREPSTGSGTTPVRTNTPATPAATIQGGANGNNNAGESPRSARLADALTAYRDGHSPSKDIFTGGSVN